MSRSLSGHVQEGTSCLAFRNASIPVAIPPQSSIMCTGLRGKVNSGRFARDGGSEEVAGLGGISIPLEGVCGADAAEQVGTGRTRSHYEGIVRPLPLLFRLQE